MNKPEKIVLVGGAHSKVGKTTICSILLRELSDYGAIKFTKDVFEPALVEDEKVILQKGKDSAVMAEAGARKVILISSCGRGFKEAIYTALERMSSFKGVIIEGNYPIEFLTPDLVIFVIGPDKRVKPSAIRIAEMADIVVINSERMNRDLRSIPDILNKNAEVFFMDLKKKDAGELNNFIRYIRDILC